MSVSIDVNGLSVVHQGSDGIAIATVPDVCKTPAPGGPVPLPYPNIARSQTLKKGSKRVKADGGNSIALKGSEFATSTGDEPGTAGGVKSGTQMKEATWLTFSMNVKVEGQSVCRLTDKMMMNHGNTVCLGGEMQKPLPKNWNLQCVLDILCKKDKKTVDTARTKLQVFKTDTLVFDDPYYDGKRWTTKRFFAGGTAQGNKINITRDTSCEDAATTIYHEVWHTQQDHSVLKTMLEKEIDAYYNTEIWTILRGLPSQGPGEGLRVTKPNGTVVASRSGAAAYVKKYYPVPASVSKPFPMGKTMDGKTILSDGTIRPPEPGDTFPASSPTNSPNAEQIPSKDLKCP